MEENDDEEWAQDRLEEFPVRTKYVYSERLTDIVTSSPLPYATWRSVFEDFKPINKPSRVWLDEGRNELIRSWVNLDPVFLSIRYHGLSKLVNLDRTYWMFRSSMLYALTEGYCNDYHYKNLEDLLDDDNGTEFTTPSG